MSKKSTKQSTPKSKTVKQTKPANSVPRPKSRKPGSTKKLHMKYATIYLPYFKQGDDLAAHLESTANAAEVLEAHAAQMDDAASQLRAIKSIVAGEPVTIDTDTHHIGIEAEDATVDRLVAAGLAKIEDFDSEEDERVE